MYSVEKKKKKYISKMNIVMEGVFDDMNGFLLPSKQQYFMIQQQKICHIKVISPILARPFIEKKVQKKYQKLLEMITELLLDDDESGESFRIALNQIEKFRQEIKNKYRIYLEKKELTRMARQLSVLQEEAKKNLLELQSHYFIDHTRGNARK